MFHLKDTKEFKDTLQKWTDLKKRRYLESMTGVSRSSRESIKAPSTLPITR
jgi:hypothetical protein